MKIGRHLQKWIHEKQWKKWQETSHVEHAEHFEDVAVPEFHTGKVKHPAEQPEYSDESIHYENVAIPEIHMSHKRA